MAEYKINADFLINVQVLVEADSEEEAISDAKAQIISKDCDWLDPIDDPKINWVQVENEDFDICPVCLASDCDCGLDYFD